MGDEVNKLKAASGPLSLSENYKIPGFGGMDREIVLRLYFTCLSLQSTWEERRWEPVQLWDLKEQLRFECETLMQERDKLVKKRRALQRRNVMGVFFGRVAHALTRGRYFTIPPEPYRDGEYAVEIRLLNCWIELTPARLRAAVFSLQNEGYFIVEKADKFGPVVHPTRLFVSEMKKAQTLRLR